MRNPIDSLGWLEGFEPSATGTTIRVKHEHVAIGADLEESPSREILPLPGQNSHKNSHSATVRVPLLNGGFALVSSDDYELVRSTNWRARTFRNRTYAVSSAGRFMHRIITNAPVGMDVDHIDHDGLNNTRQNLRVCTRSENQANSKGRPSKRRSRFKGVSPHPFAKGVWCASIAWQRKDHSLGTFDTEEQAAAAYNRAAKELHGEFACLNPVPDIQPALCGCGKKSRHRGNCEHKDAIRRARLRELTTC